MLACALPAAARHLSPEQSLARATSENYTLAATRGKLYIFSDAKSSLITSSDANMPAVIARLDAPMTGAMPPAMEWMLAQYNNAAASQSSLDNYAKWTPVKPVVKSKWGQSAPYNALCPSGTATGCVATAMAQVIYTNRYAKCSGSVQYTDYADHLVSFNFDTATFDFDAMTDTYDDNSTAAARAEVAKLMYACGASVYMTYGPESAANGAAIEPALTNNFGYDPKYTYELWRQEFQTSEWETILYNEVKAGRPVIYGGSQPNGGGHAFVVDGYSDNGLFHINWGWSGSCDGYFSLSVLNPYDGSAAGVDNGFSGLQYAIIAAAPGATGGQLIDIPDNDEAPDLSGCMISGLTTGGDVTIGSTISVRFTMINSGSIDYNDFIHIGVYNSDNQEICYAERMNSIVPAGDAAKFSIPITVKGEKELEMIPGEYTLKVQDHWQQTLGEIKFNAVETGNGWTTDGLTFYVSNAGELDGSAVMSSGEWPHSPALTCDQPQTADLHLVFYERNTDNVVADIPGASANFNFMYNSTYNWPGGRPSVTLPWGFYDMRYFNGSTPCSERVTVRVGQTVNRMSFAPVEGKPDEAEIVGVASATDVTIPASVTVNNSEYAVTALGRSAFECSNINSLDLPSSISAIGLRALRLTNSLNGIAMRSEEPPFTSTAAFAFGLYHGCAFHVPSDSRPAYEALLPGRRVYDIFDALTGPEETVQMTVGEEKTIELGVEPSGLKANPTCSAKTSSKSNVRIIGTSTTDDGHPALTLRADKATSGTVKITVQSVQPGVAPLTFNVKVSEDSAIDEISADADAETPLYDLQGRRVTTPRPGKIYLRKGAKVIIPAF